MRDPNKKLMAAGAHFEAAAPETILRWAVDEFGAGLTMACSFGMQSVVMIDMLHRMDLLGRVEVFYLDTGVLFDETHETREKVEAKYGFRAVRVAPELTLDAQAARHGDSLWDTDPNACCQIRKVEPLRRHLFGKKAWITGMRRSHHAGRSSLPVAQWDAANGLAKVNPVATWDDKTLWRYIHQHGVPHNSLYEQGYGSIGCMPCTRPVRAGEDPRAGRWAGRAKNECGIHTGSSVRPLPVVG